MTLAGLALVDGPHVSVFEKFFKIFSVFFLVSVKFDSNGQVDWMLFKFYIFSDFFWSFDWMSRAFS